MYHIEYQIGTITQVYETTQSFDAMRFLQELQQMNIHYIVYKNRITSEQVTYNTVVKDNNAGTF